MARRSMQKRPSKLKPIERTYLFEIPVGNSYLDSGFVLSFMNRQMMKQGMEYIIESIELFGAPDNEISVSVQSLSKIGFLPIHGLRALHIGKISKMSFFVRLVKNPVRLLTMISRSTTILIILILIVYFLLTLLLF